MSVLYAAAALLLLATGVAKVRRPVPTAQALRDLGLPVRPNTGRLVGGTEVVIGTAALALGGSGDAAAVAVAYAAFAAFTVLALRSGGQVSSCGCSGRADTPPTRVHLMIDVLFTAVAVGAVIDPSGGAASRLIHADGAAFVLSAVAVAWLAWVAVTALPALSVVRTVPATPEA